MNRPRNGRLLRTNLFAQRIRCSGFGRALAPSYPDWEIEINHKGEVLEDILDQYDFFVCAPGIASRWFPSKQFQKKVFYITGFEYASQNVRRFMKVFSAAAQK